MKDKISIIIKVNNECNLKCKHCYESCGHLKEKNKKKMSLPILEKIFNLAQSSYRNINYVWFGGEPLLNGIDWYKSAIEIQKKLSNNNNIKNRLQTNGTLLDDMYATFFIKEDFNISISYDGQYNDILRQQTEKVKQGIKIVHRNHGKCGVISTIHSMNYLYQIDMYEYFKELKCPMKFNAIFPLGQANINSELSLNIEKYAKATAEFFEYWCKDSQAYPITNFIQFTKLYNGEYGCNCTYGNCLYNWLCIEPNGDITPCSRFSMDEYKLGNIFEITELDDIFNTKEYNSFANKNIIRRLKCRDNCFYYKYCNGGCSSAAANEVGLENTESQFCRIIKLLLPLIFEVLDNMANKNQINNKIVLEILNKGDK